MKYSYYPGCSLGATAREYDLSTHAVCSHLGVELAELEDWSCCGASSAHSTNHVLAGALPARNIALAQEAGHDLVVPCAACYNRLKRTDSLLAEDPRQRRELEELCQFTYTGTVAVRSLLELMDAVGLSRIQEAVVRPLSGLKLAPYYGCLLVRPASVRRGDNPDHPRALDQIMEAAGATVCHWSYKTDCCGGALSIARAGIVKELVDKILDMAVDAGASALVTACPLCVANLEMRRSRRHTLPVLYFTELLAVAMGLEGTRAWFRKHLVDPYPLLRSLGLVG
ncbi:MAG: CoB--CoM heterodisulfide reductase iron-sulfur subunit B family protein [Bacillota bacterium]